MLTFIFFYTIVWYLSNHIVIAAMIGVVLTAFVIEHRRPGKYFNETPLPPLS